MERISDIKIILGLMLLQLAVCLPFINSFPVALDEPFSIFWSQQDMGVMLNELAKGNNAPLHFILLKGWTSIFGISPFGVRSMSIVISMLTLIPIYRLGKASMSKSFAVVVALVFIFSRFMHYHALEARMYSLFVLAFVFVLLELYKVVFEEKFSWWTLAIANAVMFYTHFLGALVIGFELVILLIYMMKVKKKLLKLFLSYASALILVLPLLIQFFSRAGEFSAEGTWVEKPHITELYGNILRFFNNTLTFVLVAAILIGIIAFTLKKNWPKKLKDYIDEKLVFILLCFFITYVGMFVVSFALQPVFIDRYILFTAIPLYFIPIYLAFKLVPDVKWYILGLMVIPMIISVKFAPDNDREPDAVAQYVKDQYKELDEIIIGPPFYDFTFLYHYHRDLFEKEHYLGGIQTAYSFADFGYTKNRYIFVDANSKFLYPNNDMLSGCQEWGTLIEQKSFKGGVEVYIFAKK